MIKVIGNPICFKEITRAGVTVFISIMKIDLIEAFVDFLSAQILRTQNVFIDFQMLRAKASRQLRHSSVSIILYAEELCPFQSTIRCLLHTGQQKNFVCWLRCYA